MNGKTFFLKYKKYFFLVFYEGLLFIHREHSALINDKTQFCGDNWSHRNGLTTPWTGRGFV